MSELTSNKNYLQPSGFTVQISRQQYPNLQFFAQAVSHPSLDVGAADVPYQRQSVVVPGDKAVFGALQITFLLDEDMTTYRDMYRWLVRQVEENFAGPGTLGVTTGGDIPTVTDITVSVLTSHNNVNRQIKYVNAFPTSLGEIEFTAAEDGQYLSFISQFRFDYFEFV